MLPAIDIILPCYNANEKWHQELLSFDKVAGEQFQLNYVVVNDGSVSGDVSRQIDLLNKAGLSVKLISYKQNMGKGYALRQGVAASHCAYIVYTDIDFPFKNESTLEVIRKLTGNHCDVVAGYREESYYHNKMSWFRRLLSKSFRFFMRRLLRMPVTDTQCGLKGFNKKGREKFLATTINRYLFDFEFIYRSCKDDKLVVGTVPVVLKENVVFSSMKLKILLQESMNLVKVLLSGI